MTRGASIKLVIEILGAVALIWAAAEKWGKTDAKLDNLIEKVDEYGVSGSSRDGGLDSRIIHLERLHMEGGSPVIETDGP
jgi:hypothetical protein